MKIILALVLLKASAFAIYIVFRHKKTRVWIVPEDKFLKEWKKILIENVSYYNALNKKEKRLFESEILEFLANIKITGIDTKVETKDKILVAASGIIPIFAFPEWKYFNLTEVLLYPSSFGIKFNTEKEEDSERNILGMVGSGPLEGKMILSKKALIKGFAIETDRRNTAIHEFIHLMDKVDGSIDGLPKVLLEHEYAIPWLDLIDKKIDEIQKGKSEIDSYGGTSRIEFFAVLGEYFFETPRLLKRNHPKLYDMLVEIFDQDMAERSKKMKRIKIGRNDACYCGSQDKFKDCCGDVQFS